MNDLASLTAQPREMEIGGETYVFHPLTIHDFGKLQGWVDKQFPDPTLIAQKAIARGKPVFDDDGEHRHNEKGQPLFEDYTVSQQQFLLKSALEIAAKNKPRVGTPEADELLRSLEGTKQLVLLSIKKGRPDFSEADATALFSKIALGDIERIFAATTADLVVGDPKEPTPSAG